MAHFDDSMMPHDDRTRPPANDGGAFVPGPRLIRPPSGAGPLDGLRFAVKDLIDVVGAVTGGGNPDWAAAQRPATDSAPAVAALLAAGARLVGKTVTDELAFSLEGENAHYGTPANPAAPGHLPGGSSSGSASAVAASLADVALGTDTGGSVRVPGSFCGLFAMRPTHGAISLEGVVPFAPSYDTVGWFASSVTLLQRTGDVLLPPAPGRLPGRAMLARDAFAIAEPATGAALRAALPRTFRNAAEVDVFAGRATDVFDAYRVLQGAEIWASLGPWISLARPRFGTAIAPRFADAATISGADVARHAPIRAALRAHLAALLADDGVLVLPTAPCPALPRGAAPEAIGRFYGAALTLTSLAGHAGLPQITLPLATIGGHPVGLSLIGAAGTDRGLLAYATALIEDPHGAHG